MPQFLYCWYVNILVLVGILLSFYDLLYIYTYKHAQEFQFTYQIENNHRTVDTSLFFIVDFYIEIRFKKFVDSKRIY